MLFLAPLTVLLLSIEVTANRTAAALSTAMVGYYSDSARFCHANHHPSSLPDFQYQLFTTPSPPDYSHYCYSYCYSCFSHHHHVPSCHIRTAMHLFALSFDRVRWY